MSQLPPRMIQNDSTASQMLSYFGYPSRVWPCTNDAGSYEYLDGVYSTQTKSMEYTAIMWAVFGVIILVLTLANLLHSRPGREIPTSQGLYQDALEDENGTRNTAHTSSIKTLGRATQAAVRRYLLPEIGVYSVGRVTRLQVLIVAILLAYLTIFCFIAIVYKTWVTPIKGSTKFNTRTGLAGFSDRIGALAYALTPLTVLLSMRENVLTLLTGIPSQSFVFLHRWTAYIILIQSVVHTIGWTIIEGRLYQPQPSTYQGLMAEIDTIWGCVALGIIILMWVLAFKSVRGLLGYEFFKVSHFVLACVYIGACWGHWTYLACWMIASFGIIGLDYGLRFVRTMLIHLGYWRQRGGYGFQPIQASLKNFTDSDGTVIRIDFDCNIDPWHPGQHFFLTFPELSFLQSHPFTAATLPAKHPFVSHQTYIIRCRGGQTSKLAQLATEETSAKTALTPIVLAGPYGSAILNNAENVIVICGGTGISIGLPIVSEVLLNGDGVYQSVQLVWMVRRACNTEWIASELQELTRLAKQNPKIHFKIHIFVTREREQRTEDSEKTDPGVEKTTGEPSTNDAFSLSDIETTYLGDKHPNISELLPELRAELIGRIQVIGSGPPPLGTDLRAAVASLNDPRKLMRGEATYDVSLYWDDRAYY